MQNLLKSATVAVFALQLLSPPQTIAMDTHDLDSSGCWFGNFPEVTMMKKRNAALHYHVHHDLNDQHVQGLHLTLEGPQGLRATWMNPAALDPSSEFNPVCIYGAERSNLSRVVDAYFYTYTAGMFTHTLNSAVLDLSEVPCLRTSASPCARSLSYLCGDKAYGFSRVLHVQIEDSVAPLTPGPQVAVVGDLGVPQGLKTIQSVAARLSHASSAGRRNSRTQGVAMLLHAGDISYADDYSFITHNNSYVWVDYMNSLQSVAGRVPYMTAPGNHEAQFDFSAYLNWLPMPHRASRSSSSFWFSFDYLGVHVLSFSTEHDFSPNSTQHHWIQQVLAGHNHQYERSYPVYRGQVTQKHYTNPQAPVYIVNGAAGNPEVNDPSFEPNVEWRAAYAATFETGFLLMTPSQSQLTFEYVMNDQDDVVDSFTIVRKLVQRFDSAVYQEDYVDRR